MLAAWRLGGWLAAVLAVLLVCVTFAEARVVWLCHPDHVDDPCSVPMGTTVLSKSGEVLGTRTVRRARRPKADCFYLYPTVSEQKRPIATLRVDREQRSIARLHAARFAQVCRVFAPMYRQQTLAGLATGNASRAQLRITYRSVLTAWRAFLRAAQGRPFVLIGHSQGSELLRRLIAREIDGSRRLRQRLVSAVLLGGNVAVGTGRSVGGDFRHVPACERIRQRQCVVAYSAFQGSVPDGALYGRVGGEFNPGDPMRLDVLCTNPASLSGGRAPLRSLFPARGSGLTVLGIPRPDVRTPWFELRGVYSGECSAAGGAHVLQIAGAPLLPFPDAGWGLHLLDVNLALGDLVGLVGAQVRAP